MPNRVGGLGSAPLRTQVGTQEKLKLAFKEDRV